MGIETKQFMGMASLNETLPPNKDKANGFITFIGFSGGW